jgi:creatinine amidohydrolase
MVLAHLTWPEAERLERDLVVLSPIGALEQHSRHLPFFTDTLLCEAIATRLEEALPADVLLLPTQWLGASAHHLGMVGTLSATNETCLRMICEPLRCLLARGFRRVFILNGHGGNTDVFHLALRQLAIEFPQAVLSGASYWELAQYEIAALLKGNLKEVGHACEFETSLMLHLFPNLVRTEEILDDTILPALEPLRGVFRPLDMKRQTRHGGHGQPTLASAENGKALVETLVLRVVAAIQALRTL